MENMTAHPKYIQYTQMKRSMGYIAGVAHKKVLILV